MEEQVPSEHRLNIVPLWMKIFFVVLCSLLVIGGIWKHGLRSWDWLTPAVFLGIFAFPAGETKPLGKNLRWPLRVVFALWVITCCAWAVHFWGWVPGLALGGISLLSPSRDKFCYEIVTFKFLGRLLGIPLPTKFQQREGVLRLLSFNEYVCLYGALGFGMAMWITSVADDYFQSTILGNPSPNAAMWRVFELAGWLAGGCAFGWMVWGGYRDTHSPSVK